jgi:hypothetical protein
MGQRYCPVHVLGVSRGHGALCRYGRVPGEHRGRRAEQHGVPGGAGQVRAPQPMRVLRIIPSVRGPPKGQMCQTCPPTALIRAAL